MSAAPYYDEFRQAAAHLPGQRLPWLGKLRETGMAQFMAMGFPTPRQEAWKYTNASPIAKGYFSLAAVDNRVRTADLMPFLYPQLSPYQMVFVNGHFAPPLSALDHFPEGATVISLAAGFTRHPDAMQSHLGRYVDSAANSFAALNTAFINDGVYIHLARGTVLDRPLHVLFVVNGAAQTMTHPRSLFIVEAHSRATVIETHISLEQGEYLNNAVTEIVLEQDASLEHYTLGLESEQVFHTSASYIQQARDSRYNSHAIILGGRLVRNDVQNVLDGEGAECAMNGLYVTGGRQHVDHHIRIDHRKPHCTSRQWYKGVLDGQSRGVFNGRVVVYQDAQHSDAQQNNNNLLLSQDAEADSMPQLEIYADDVKCAHGATVGRLDEDALFYLRSRAVDETLARGILVYAFTGDILERMKLAPVRNALRRQLSEHLPGHRIEDFI